MKYAVHASAHMHRYRLLSVSSSALHCSATSSPARQFCGGPPGRRVPDQERLLTRRQAAGGRRPKARRGLTPEALRAAAQCTTQANPSCRTTRSARTHRHGSGDHPTPAFTWHLGSHHTSRARRPRWPRCCCCCPFYRPSIVQSRVSRCSCNSVCERATSPTRRPPPFHPHGRYPDAWPVHPATRSRYPSLLRTFDRARRGRSDMSYA